MIKGKMSDCTVHSNNLSGEIKFRTIRLSTEKADMASPVLNRDMIMFQAYQEKVYWI